MKRKVVILLLLCLFCDFGSPFTRGAFEFDLEDSADCVRQPVQWPLSPVGVRVEPVLMNRVLDQPKVGC